MRLLKDGNQKNKRLVVGIQIKPGGIMDQKKGWIMIVEAFTAIMLVTGVLLVIFDRGEIDEEIPSKRIFEQEQGILRHIQLNNSLRDDVFSISHDSLPANLSSFPERLRNEIASQTPGYLDCDAKICALGADCPYTGGQEKDVYTQKAAIISSLDSYDPRELRLFCSPR
jgi:hypothetical protein